MRCFCLVLAGVIVPAAMAWAQPASTVAPPVEQIIVTAQKLSTEIKGFVGSYATRSLAGTGVITRWKKGISAQRLPVFPIGRDDFVTSRIRKIAVMAGAPVAALPCKPNIHVYFASKPQELLDAIRENGGARVLTATPSKAKQIAIMNSPIQAWYATGTRDEHNGLLTFDNNDDNGWNGCICDIGPPPGPGVRVLDPNGTRAGLRSELVHVLVIADVNQTKVFRFTAVSDYIAMLALTEMRTSGVCKQLPSITNLTHSDCDDGLRSPMRKPPTPTLPYLKGVYSVDPGEGLRTQQKDIAAEMEKTLTAH